MLGIGISLLGAFTNSKNITKVRHLMLKLIILDYCNFCARLHVFINSSMVLDQTNCSQITI